MVRSVALTVLLVSAFAAPSSALAVPSDPAEKYVSKDGKYSVVFPSKPKELSQDIPLPTGKSKMYMALLEVSQEQALIGTYNDYPDEIKDTPPRKVLEGVRDGAKGDGKIISDKEITYGKDKVPGREYYFEKGAFHQRFRVYLKGTRLYQVGLVGKSKADVTGKDADKFLDSFEIAK